MAKSLAALNSLLKDLGIPPAEQAALAACVEQAKSARERKMRSFGSPLTAHDMLRVPYLLGWVTVEVLRHPGLALETKRRMAAFTLRQARPLEDGGTPYGLIVLASFLAGQGALDLAGFTAMMKVAEIDRTLIEGVKVEEMRVLSDWLITHRELDDRQRLWWLWFLTSNCEVAQVGRSWIEYLLAHPALANDFKHQLCEAWLSPRPPGPAPRAWKSLDQSLAAGLDGGADDDLDGALLAPLDAEIDDSDDELEGFEAFEEAEEAEADDLFASMSVVSHLMRQALGGYVLVPHYIERRAVLGLAQAGDDPQTVCELYLGTSRDERGEVLSQGVADILSVYHAQMPPEVVRALVERGLSVGQVKARKEFYALAAELYGAEVWARAREDSAASVRAWAAKQTP